MAADLWMVLTWETTDFLECFAQLHRPCSQEKLWW
jgi:hypothetical protein